MDQDLSAYAKCIRSVVEVFLGCSDLRGQGSCGLLCSLLQAPPSTLDIARSFRAGGMRSFVGGYSSQNSVCGPGEASPAPLGFLGTE